MTRDVIAAPIHESLCIDPEDLISLSGDPTTFHDESDTQPLAPSRTMEPDLEACKESEESGTLDCSHTAVGDRGSSKLTDRGSTGKRFGIKMLFADPRTGVEKLVGIWYTYVAPHIYKSIVKPYPRFLGLQSFSSTLVDIKIVLPSEEFKCARILEDTGSTINLASEKFVREILRMNIEPLEAGQPTTLVPLEGSVRLRGFVDLVYFRDGVGERDSGRFFVPELEKPFGYELILCKTDILKRGEWFQRALPVKACTPKQEKAETREEQYRANEHEREKKENKVELTKAREKDKASHPEKTRQCLDAMAVR